MAVSPEEVLRSKAAQAVAYHAWESALLAPFPIQAVFTGQPLPLGGQHLSPAERVENRRRWCEVLTLPAEPLFVPRQVHGEVVLKASDWLSQGPAFQPEADGVWLDQGQVTGLVQTADCVPLLVYAPDLHQALVLHAGWRGTALGITTQAVQALLQAGAKVEQLVAVLGPSIRQACYEVGPEVVAGLQASLVGSRFEGQPELWCQPNLNKPASEKPGHAFVDVKRVNALQLEALGLGPEQIEVLPLCTACLSHPECLEPNLAEPALWSHRRGHWQRQGLLATLL